MQLLLDGGAEIKITENVVENAVLDWQNGEAIMKLLLDRTGELKVTDRMILCAMKNWWSGGKVMKMKLLLNAGAEVQVTDKVIQVVHAVALESRCGEEAMRLLLGRQRTADFKNGDGLVSR